MGLFNVSILFETPPKFNESDDVKTKQIKLEKGVILEVSCDPIDEQGQFHIYRE